MSTELKDLTQAQYDAAEQICIAMIRSAAPTLDLRTGTVIREQLIRPAAQFYAVDEARMEALRQQQSLLLLSQQANPDPADVNALLSNFNMTVNAGALARGSLLVRVDGNRTYTLSAGQLFAAVNGQQYETAQLYTASTDSTLATLVLQQDSEGYYFILPVVAAQTGAAYNLPQGTAIEPVDTFYGYVSAITYTDLTGGLEGEQIEQLIGRIPAALSHRSLTDRTAIEARLRASFDSTDLRIQALSVQGMGDAAQLRDRHSLMGCSVGGHIDVYVRTFTEPATQTLTLIGTRVADSTYQVTTPAVGVWGVRTCTDEGAQPALAGYDFTVVRTPLGADQSRHDFLSTSQAELFGTTYEQLQLTILDVNDTADQHTFKVELYYAPGIDTLQTFCDDAAVRNREADVVVRSPLVCLVGVAGTVYVAAGTPLTTSELQTAVAAYINQRSFVPRLTRSELVRIILAAGATRVDLGTSLTGLRLTGALSRPDATNQQLSGDSLDLTAVLNPQQLVSPDTCCFATETRLIQLNVVAE